MLLNLFNKKKRSLQNVVAFVMIMVKWCIPDIPGLLREEIRREAYVTNEIIIKQEAIRAQSIGIRKYIQQVYLFLLLYGVLYDEKQ